MSDNELQTYLAKVGRMRDRPRKVDRAAPDPRDGSVYATTPEIKLAVQLALISGRPLLLRGEPGSGKSSLAAYVARNLGWRYYEEVITARTEAQDLLWRFDSVRRLARATAPQHDELNDVDYIEPGVMWWVLDPESARLRGGDGDKPGSEAVDPFHAVNHRRRSRNAVVLLDEMDKADPDVPNALLVPLGSSEFRVQEIDRRIPTETSATNPRPRTLVIVTTNEERALPDAFVRRCIVHHLDHPDPRRLQAIAKRHLRDRGLQASKTEMDRYGRLAERLMVLRQSALDQRRRPPSTAEYLDAVFAIRELDVDPDDDAQWPPIERLTLIKERK